MESQRPDRVAILGDTIGYGPDPGACLERARRISDVMLCGNHEKEALLPVPNELSEDARELLEWSLGQVEGSDAWRAVESPLRTFDPEAAAQASQDRLSFVHGSPQLPFVRCVWPGYHTRFLAFHDQVDAFAAGLFSEFPAGHSFCAHTHTPALSTRYAERDLFPVHRNWNRTFTFWGPRTVFYVPAGDAVLEGLAGRKVVINPGSVGPAPRRRLARQLLPVRRNGGPLAPRLVRGADHAGEAGIASGLRRHPRHPGFASGSRQLAWIIHPFPTAARDLPPAAVVLAPPSGLRRTDGYASAVVAAACPPRLAPRARRYGTARTIRASRGVRHGFEGLKTRQALLERRDGQTAERSDRRSGSSAMGKPRSAATAA
jgi:hypothetical protein